MGAFSNVKEKLSGPFENAKKAIGNVADGIKGFFSNMKLSLPKIKLPHFKITGKLSLSPPSIPKLSIDWYKEGGIMTEPTLFQYNPYTGRAKVGGEAGDEAVAPISTLQQYVKAAVQDENSAIVAKLERVVELLQQFFPDALAAMDQVMVLDTGVLVAQTAPAMNEQLGQITMQKGRGRG